MKDERLLSLLERYAATRDPALRNELAEAYLPLTRAVARRFVGRGAELEDLEQVAAIALLKALERFEPERGNRFVTYAVPTIAGDLRNYLRDRVSPLRMPRDLRQKLYQINREQEAFEREQLRAPTAEELAARLKMTAEELLTLLAMRANSECVSLDLPVGEEGDTFLQDLIAGQEDRYGDMERREWMDWVLSKVNDTEREMLLLRYRDGLGQRETAKRLGVSQMQVSRLERRVLQRLRAMNVQP